MIYVYIGNHWEPKIIDKFKKKFPQIEVDTDVGLRLNPSGTIGGLVDFLYTLPGKKQTKGVGEASNFNIQVRKVMACRVESFWIFNSKSHIY